VRVSSTSKSARTPAFLPTEGTPPIRSSHDHPPRRLRVAGDEVAPDLGSQRPNQGLLPLDLSPAQHPCAASTAATRHRSGSGMGKVRKGAWKAIWSEWEARRAPRVMSPPGRTRRRPMGSGGTGEGERRRGVFRGERGLVCGPGGRPRTRESHSILCIKNSGLRSIGRVTRCVCTSLYLHRSND
jgi:hypothetical protein